MKIDLGNILKTLGLPVGLVVVFSAVLALFGVSLDTVLATAASLVGLWLVIGVVIDVLKLFGVVNDGTSGKWSAALNLVALAGIAVTLGLKPTFDFPAFDLQLITVAKFATLLLGYIAQMVGTKAVHTVTTQALGVRAFSFSASGA